MEAGSRLTLRLLPSHLSRLTAWPANQNRLYPFSKVIFVGSRHIRSRNLSSSSRILAPDSPLLFSSSNSSHSGGPPTYFSQRPSLPANTIIRFVPQQTAWIVERMGKFNRILEPGLAILIPFIDRIAYVKTLKESAIEIPSQNAITADNVTLELDGILYTRVFDAYKAR